MSEYASGLSGVFGRLARRGSGDSVRSRAVPARIMTPRIVFCFAVFVLVLFGLLMIYSASSVEGSTAAVEWVRTRRSSSALTVRSFSTLIALAAASRARLSGSPDDTF